MTIFLTLCRIMGVTDIYEAYFGSNPDSLVNGLNTAGREKVLDYIELLHIPANTNHMYVKYFHLRAV